VTIEYTSAVRDVLIDPMDALQLALDVAAVPHHPLDERLHPYQVDAVAHLHAHPRSGLLLIPGLGKTASVLNALTSVHLPALVIAPKRVAEETWPEEIPIWRPDLTFSLVRGSVEQRQARLKEDTDLHIITRDTFGGDLVSRKKPRYNTVVIDELSGFKNRASQRWKHANRLTKNMPYVWGLTGTPSPNSLLDLWPQIFLLDRGARLERTLTAYRTKYFLPGGRLPNGIITNWTLRPEADRVIQHRIRDLCFSVDQSNVKMPVKNDVYHRFDLPTKARKAYDDMNRHFVAEVGETLASVEHAAAKSSKLSQIAAGFMYHSGLIGAEESDEADITHHHMIRMELLQSILEDAQGAPALVFYRFKEDRRRLLHLEGAVDIKSPHAVDRWNRGNIPILLAHPASAGHGLNLQHGGSLLVWYTMDWSSEWYVQGTGRLVRQGQPSPAVAVHHLIAKETVDEQVLDVVQGRITRQDALLKVLERGTR
jgi:superfamily II DNA or RNA helicase